MFGTGYANIIAALIVAFAIIWTGGFGGKKEPAADDYAAWYARAVGDIRNDVVVNCGCCGEEGQRRAAAKAF